MGKSYIPSNYAPRTGSTPADYKYHFNLWFEEAKRIKRENSLAVPAEALLIQWAHETGHFSSSVFQKNYNLAGLSYSGKSYNLLTKGTARPEGGYYLKAPSFQAAADAYAEFLMVNPRYKEFLQGGNVTTIKGAFDAWVAAGWAADGAYQSALWSAFNSIIIKGRNGFGDSYDYATARSYVDSKGSTKHPPMIVNEGINAIATEYAGGAPSIGASALLAKARSYIGKVTYSLGSANFTNTPYRGDCAAFTRYIWTSLGGKDIGQSTPPQILLDVPKITNIDDFQPGDLIFFKNTYTPGEDRSYAYNVTHVGFVSDKKGYMIDLASSGCKEESYMNSYWKPKILFARRILGSSYDTGTGGAGGSISFDLTGGSIDSMNELGAKLAHTNSLTRIAGISPDPTKDNYPKHRYEQNPFTLRIGDSQFFIPPINIKHSKVGSTGYVPTMRQRTSMLNKSGWTEGQLVLNLKFADIDQINGYKVEAPDNRKYHMDGVRSLLAQFHKNPMLPIRNEYINNALGIYNVIIKDIIVSTVDGFPNVLDVTIVANECSTVPYTGTTEFMYDVCFNYPIWRWYYHNLLDEKETNRIESVYLRPIDERMRNTLNFRILDEEQVVKMQNDLVDKAVIEGTVKDLNPQYLLSKFKGANLRMLMGDWDLGDVIVTSVSGSMSKELSRINMMEYEQPVYQDMGGIHKVFEVNLKMTDRDQVYSLEQMVAELEETAREYRHMFVGGFCEVQNDIINMCGVEFCMIEELQTSTTPINGVYEATIILREFNPNQGNNETLNGIETDVHQLGEDHEFNELDEEKYTSHKADRFNTVREEWMIERLIKQIELYPDLRLPSYVDANEALTKINTWRKAKGYELVPFDKFPQPEGDIWVEPDFYFMYPQPIDAFNAMKAGELGTKMINMLDTGKYEGYSTENKWENYLDIAGGAEHLLGRFTGSVAENQFNLEEMQESYQKTASTDIVFPSEPMYTNFFDEWGSDRQMPEPNILASYMLYDQVKYDQRLRLTRFFPTYFMLFVDEGAWIDGRRLWNTHYAYHAIHEITVTKDKDNPLALAYLRLSNMYGTFNSDSKLRDPEYYKDFEPRGFIERVKTMWKSWGYTAKDIMVDARQMMDHAELQVGARIHIRMGNSSNTGNLPTIFNGQITSVNDGVDLEIFAQSDGVELINGPISGNVGDSTPGEPHNALMKYFTKRMSNYWFSVASDLEFFYNYESFYGIEHFGWVASKDSRETGMTEWVKAVFESEHAKAEDTASVNAFDAFIAGAGQIFGFLGDLAKATIQNAKSLITENLNFIVGAVTGTPTFNTYDVMKNIFRGDPDEPSTGVNKKEGKAWDGSQNFFQMAVDIFKSHGADGENNVRLQEYGKTVWDIGQTLATFVPEFIFGVHDHGFRSTAFFGMPHWLVKFRYHKPAGAGNDLNKWQEEVKPYQQAHFISSNVDIIKNDIKASSELLKHIMTAIYTTGDATNSKEGITVYADKSMLKDQQRRTVIDTGVLQDLFGPDSIITFLMTWIIKPTVNSIVGTGTAIIEGVYDLARLAIPNSIEKAWGMKKDITGNVANTISEFLDVISEPGKHQAESIVIGSMQRNFAEMYQGEIITFGMPAIKPLDLFYLSDERRLMSGTVQVGKVTHSLTRETGLVSIIKPDLVVSRVDGKGQRNVVLNTVMFALAAGSMFTLRHISKTKFAGKLASNSYKKAKFMAIKTAKGADWVANRFTGLKPLEHFAKYIDETKIDDWVKKGANWLRRGIVTAVFAGVAVEAFQRWWDKETKYNNVIYIHPLFKAGVPFTAGIKGAMHIIPNYIDPKYYDPTGVGNGVPTGSATAASPTPSTTSTALQPEKVADVVGKATGQSTLLAGSINFTKYTGVKTTTVTKSFDGYATTGKIGHPFNTYTSKRITNFNAALGAYGVDLQYTAVSVKTPNIYAIADGKVVWAKTMSGKGLTVIIQHEAPVAIPQKKKIFFSSYSHLKANSLPIAAGSTVKKGDKIGVMGNTEAKSVRLHLEIHIDSYTDSASKGVGSRVNPVDFFKKAGVSI